ncbi:MAG TPA: RIO1 family regulatory kinase/ATPase [Ktedonobacterales bacterium]
MKYKFDANLEDDETDHLERFERMKPRPAWRHHRSITGPVTPQKKASYEGNQEVQRWLKEQSVDDGAKVPFNPTFLASLRDAPWILSSLGHFYEENLITDVLHTVKSGKEATVYCCAANPATGQEYLAAKVYRPRMFRSLSNDAIYREGREERDETGRVISSARQQAGAIKKTSRYRRDRMAAWIEYEFQTQLLLHEAGADVPKPFAQIGNAVLMEYIGEEGAAAPLLREVTLAREEAQPLFERLMRNIECWLAHNRIHGDLSEYNILYWQGNVTIIDFAQAVDPHFNDRMFPLLARDIERVCRYFARYGVRANANAHASELWSRYITGGL